jgi:ABC-type multidrug transport system, ATPase and permease components
MPKKKEKWHIWGRLVKYCKPYLAFILLAMGFTITGVVLTIIGPGYISQITDEILKGLQSSIDMNRIGKIGRLLIVFNLCTVAFRFFQGYIMVVVTQKIAKSLRAVLAKKVDRLPLAYFDQESYGDVLSRVTNDIDMIGQTLNQSVSQLVGAGVMFVVCLVAMSITDIILTITAVSTSFVGFAFMKFIMSKSKKYFSAQQKDLGKINGHIEEIYSGHIVVKVCNGTTYANEVFEEINEKLYTSAWKSQFLSGLAMIFMNFVGNFGYVAVCIVGAMLAMRGTINFGVIVAFLMYVRMFTQPLSQISQVATRLQSTVAASERVFEFLDEEELSDERDKTQKISEVKGNVVFSNVKFGYKKDQLIIKDFSVNVRAGEKVAIVGPTGAGKTTIVNLLMRFYELNGGEILLEGMPISQVSRENVHEQFCMVLQDSWIFEGSIKENIIYSKSDVTDEQVINACKLVGLHHFIKTLPQGYATVLDDKTNLSVGQKQLVTIARAMIQNAPLLILDEATSSVDTRIEAKIQNAMDELMKGRTSFVIAHRLSTIKNADKILVMKDGDIIESGKHDELLHAGGFYADLYNSQFEQL